MVSVGWRVLMDGEFWMASLDGWRVLDGEFWMVSLMDGEFWMASFGW